MDQVSEIFSVELAQWLVAVIALLALARPNLESLYRRWNSSIVAHPRERIEIGFSGYGPSIGITGSLQSVGSDNFVRDIKIKLVRLSDNKTHHFSLGFSRNRRITPQGETAEAEIATGFMVRKGEARTIDFIFFDSPTQKRFEGELVQLREAWQNATISDGRVADLIKIGDISEAVSEFRKNHPQIIEQAFRSMEKNFYWDSGQYKLDMSIECTRPQKNFRFTCNFYISDRDSETLSGNFSRVLLSITGLPGILFEYPWVVSNWSHIEESTEN